MMKWSIKSYKLPTPKKAMILGRAMRRFFAGVGASMLITTNYPIVAVICIVTGEFVDLLMNCYSEDGNGNIS